MIDSFQKNIIRFFILILVQIFIFNNIHLSGFIVPYVYILFILLLPFETPGWILLVTAFITGLFIDIFMDTLGMHTIACVSMAFIRPFVLNIIAPREGYETGTKPRAAYFGALWFIKYAAFLIFVHHFILFYVEVFHFGTFFITFLRVVFSSAITLLLIVLSQFFVFQR